MDGTRDGAGVGDVPMPLNGGIPVRNTPPTIFPIQKAAEFYDKHVTKNRHIKIPNKYDKLKTRDEKWVYKK